MLYVGVQAEAMKKLSPAAITKVVARQIFDSRGNPTVQADVYTHKVRWGFYRCCTKCGGSNTIAGQPHRPSRCVRPQSMVVTVQDPFLPLPVLLLALA